MIGIDEGQFFPDIVNWCEEMANRYSFWSKYQVKLIREDEKLCLFRGKIVLVAALDGTFQRLPFPEMLALVPLAEAVTKLQAVCMVCFQVKIQILSFDVKFERFRRQLSARGLRRRPAWR